MGGFGYNTVRLRNNQYKVPAEYHCFHIVSIIALPWNGLET